MNKDTQLIAEAYDQVLKGKSEPKKVSNCCEAPETYEHSGLCSKCKEHAEFAPIEEGNFGKALKSLGAAAALAASAHAGDPDSVNPHERGATVTQEHPKVIDHASELLSAEHYNRQIIDKKIPYNDPKAVEAIAKDSVIAKDYIQSRMLLGQEIPASIEKAFPNLIRNIKAAFNNPGV